MNVFVKFKTRVSRYGIKYVLKIIVRNKIYHPLDNFILSIEKKILRKKKLKDTIVIESHNDFDSNGGAFYEYLIRNGYNKKYKIIWLIRNSKPDRLPVNVKCFNMFQPSIVKSYYICTARYMTADHVIIEKVRDDQKTYYLTHGAVGLKAFKGKVILPQKLDYCLCPSEYLAPILAQQYMLEYPNKKQVILGYPMHDVFYRPIDGELNKITRKQYSKVILWMPTFRIAVGFHRNDSISELPMGIPIIEDMDTYEELNELLKKHNVLLILKLHPMQDMTYIKINSISNIIVLDGMTVKKLGIDNYQLMRETDALISDYSSVAYDYLHTGKPIAYTLDDADSYKLGFIVDNPREWMAGNIIYTMEELIQFINDIIVGKDSFKEKRKKLFDKVFQYHDGNSSERLAIFMGLTKER